MFGGGVDKPVGATTLLLLNFDDGSKVDIWVDSSGLILIGIGIGILLRANFQRRK